MRRIMWACLPLLLVAMAPGAPFLPSVTTGSLTLDPQFHTISVRAGFSSSNEATGNGATVEYRQPGQVTWRTAPAPFIDTRTTINGMTNWAANEARTKIFGLTPGTTYEVRVTFSGTVTGTNPLTGTVTTRSDPPPAPIPTAGPTKT